MGKRRLSATVCLPARCAVGGGWWELVGWHGTSCGAVHHHSFEPLLTFLSHAAASLPIFMFTLHLAHWFKCEFCRILIYLSHLARQSQGKFVLFFLFGAHFPQRKLPLVTLSQLSTGNPSARSLSLSLPSCLSRLGNMLATVYSLMDSLDFRLPAAFHFIRYHSGFR